MRATWSQPVAEVVVFSNDFASRRDRPRLEPPPDRAGLAWCLDLTALLTSGADDTIGPLLHELTDVMRQGGLIPVTTERFA